MVPSKPSLRVPGGPPVFCLLCVNCAPNYGISKKWTFQSAEITRVAGRNVGSLCRKRPNTVLPSHSSPLCSHQEAHACAWHLPVFSPLCSLVVGARVGALDRELENLCCSRFMPLVAVNSVMYQVLTLALQKRCYLNVICSNSCFSSVLAGN